MSWIRVRDKEGHEHVVTQAAYADVYKKHGFVLVHDVESAEKKKTNTKKPTVAVKGKE